MAVKISWEEERNAFRVVLPDYDDPKTFVEGLSDTVGEVARKGARKILIDGSRITKFVPFTYMYQMLDRFSSEVTEKIGLARVALVVPDPLSNDERFLETVANNRNLDLKGFTDIDAAWAWLNSWDPGSPP